MIDENVTLAPAPGHTPGSCVVLLSSGQDRAVFVGDLLHNPVQVVEPRVQQLLLRGPCGCPQSRHRVLGEAADAGRIVFPAHLRGGRPGMRVERSGSRFAIRSWASLEATA